MRHIEQVRVLQGLIDHIDSGTNVDAGRQLKNPTSAYLSPERAVLEWQQLFSNHPQLIGLSADLAEPGCFFTSEDLGKPILCTRDKEGTFHAFINACRHRGTIVESAARGKRYSFSCPFHGWTYSPAGDLVAVPKEEQFGSVDKACHSLVKLPAVEAHGLLWIHPDPEGKIDLDELLGEELRDEMESWALEDNVLDGEDTYPHAMNWKLAIDTFGETYHFDVLHKNTLAATLLGNVQMYDTFKRNHRMMLCSREIENLRNLPTDQWDVMRGTIPVYYLFPNIQLIMGLAGPTLVRVYPNADNPHDSFSRISFYVKKGLKETVSEEVQREISERMNGFGQIIRDEDYVAAASSHRGMRAQAFDHVVFGRNEPALQHYHSTYNEVLGLPPLEPV